MRNIDAGLICANTLACTRFIQSVLKEVKVKIKLTAICLSALLTQSAIGTTVYYQPTPYPSTVPIDYHHIWDGWLNNFFSQIMTFQQDDRLQFGGWGDTYRTYVRFDTTGLPATVNQATLLLYPNQIFGTSPTARVYRVDGDWDAATTPKRVKNPKTTATTAMTWSTQPNASFLGLIAAPTMNALWSIDITPQYNTWNSSTTTNFGIRIDPSIDNSPVQSIANFRSSRYADFSTDPLADEKRPVVKIDFTSPIAIPDFKMPLPGGYKWLVTTEVGGTDCVGPVGSDPWPTPSHIGSNYFAIDFSAKNLKVTGTTDFVNIPILAAADAKVIEVGDSLRTRIGKANGYYIVLKHLVNGVETSFSTRYLHLAAPPARTAGADGMPGALLTVGDSIAQGQQLGTMGSTGTSARHLHFGVRYNDDGASSVPELTYVVMDGLLLKSYQTECANDVPKKYFLSGNLTY